jgi:hypothetical protein
MCGASPATRAMLTRHMPTIDADMAMALSFTCNDLKSKSREPAIPAFFGQH